MDVFFDDAGDFTGIKGVTYSSMLVPVKIWPFGFTAEGATGWVPSS